MLARGSFRYVTTAALVWTATILLALAVGQAWTWTMTLLATLLLLFFLWFFRDPERTIGDGLVSPADGRVLNVQQEGDLVHVTIFMTPWNVHVNRAPVDARVEHVQHRPGGHLPAFKKESSRNERLEVQFSNPKETLHVRLIAGTLARRIHSYLIQGAEVKKGERIGLIAFGSRCEIAFPATRYRLQVSPGDWVKAGETSLAKEVL